MLNEHPVKLALCLTLPEQFELVVSSLSAAKIRVIWSDIYSKYEMSRVKLNISQNRKRAPKNSPQQLL